MDPHRDLFVAISYFCSKVERVVMKPMTALGGNGLCHSNTKDIVLIHITKVWDHTMQRLFLESAHTQIYTFWYIKSPCSVIFRHNALIIWYIWDIVVLYYINLRSLHTEVFFLNALDRKFQHIKSPCSASFDYNVHIIWYIQDICPHIHTT